MTLIQDGWSDIYNNSVIATTIHTGSKTYLLNAVDTCAHKKTASYCASLFEKAISEAERKINPLVGFLRFSELWFRRHLMMTSATYSYIDYDIIVY